MKSPTKCANKHVPWHNHTTVKPNLVAMHGCLCTCSLLCTPTFWGAQLLLCWGTTVHLPNFRNIKQVSFLIIWGSFRLPFSTFVEATFRFCQGEFWHSFWLTIDLEDHFSTSTSISIQVCLSILFCCYCFSRIFLWIMFTVIRFYMVIDMISGWISQHGSGLTPVVLTWIMM